MRRAICTIPTAAERDYAIRREAQERAAAKVAATLAARRAHQELAKLYAQRAGGLPANLIAR